MHEVHQQVARTPFFGVRGSSFAKTEISKQASSADLLLKVRRFSALNPRMPIEGKWDAIDPPSASPLLFLRIDAGVLPTACMA